MPSWHTPQPEALPEFSTIVLRTSIEEVRPGYGRTVLENEALPLYLPKRRWFASKTENADQRAHRLLRADQPGAGAGVHDRGRGDAR